MLHSQERVREPKSRILGQPANEVEELHKRSKIQGKRYGVGGPTVISLICTIWATFTKLHLLSELPRGYLVARRGPQRQL
jgi:hypothetical protein